MAWCSTCGQPMLTERPHTHRDVTIFICPVCEAVIEGDSPCPNGPHEHSPVEASSVENQQQPRGASLEGNTP